jgi:RNA polymerase sigma-70 factor (ECF subfamily)
MTHSHVDLVDERSLLAAARAGDERAFGRLVERHRNGLEQFCYLMLGDRHDARGALEETVLCAWRERELVEPIATVRMWLYRIAMRACLEDLDVHR